jgi:hypothetical protein
VRLEFDAYVDVVAEELDRIVDLATDAPKMLIDVHPGWRMGDLLTEIGACCARWQEMLETGSAPGPNPSPSPSTDTDTDGGTAAARAYGPGEVTGDGDRLLGALRAVGPGFRLARDGEEESTSDDVARIAALTCAVYRSDIERSAARPGRIETELAVDGVDERLERYCAEFGRPQHEPWEGSMCLIALDAPDAWMVEARRGRCSWRKGRGPAVTAVVGHASDLLLFAWGRLTPDDLAVTGDFRVAQAWRGSAR